MKRKYDFSCKTDRSRANGDRSVVLNGSDLYVPMWIDPSTWILIRWFRVAFHSDPHAYRSIHNADPSTILLSLGLAFDMQYILILHEIHSKDESIL